jgi:KaiC/GvpD/RAD55 family RecA-like ATPase
MMWAGSPTVGLVLLVAAVIPLGDMLVVLGGKGTAKTALGIHGVTALVMIVAAVPLIAGAA